MIKIFCRLVVVALLLLSLHQSAALVHAQGTKVFTAEELAQYDGKDGRPAYTAYQGKVYDVTKSTLWKAGEHFGLKAGKDLTAEMANAPHGAEVFSGFEVVGTLEGAAASVAAPAQTGESTTPAVQAQPSTEQEQASPAVTSAAKPAQKWYQQRIRIFGLSILGWSGVLLGVTFFLNFATCFALPWSKIPLPWSGSRPGPDALDVSQAHLKWSTFHKYFAWATVILGILHGVLGFMQLLGYYV